VGLRAVAGERKRRRGLRQMDGGEQHSTAQQTSTLATYE
jgi:hypothetical protein